jgi:UDP-glucose 4-epimerase
MSHVFPQHAHVAPQPTAPQTGSSVGTPRALITGGTGFVGSHLAAALLERGHHVTVIDDLSTGRVSNVAGLLPHPSFELVTETIANDEVLDRLIAESDVVFHLAAAVGVQLVVEDALHTIETNVMGTGSVLNAALRHGTKVLIASTSEVYGKCVSLPASEDDDVLLGPSRNSRWSYAASKLVDEFLALAYHRQEGLPVVVFRLFNTVGPRQSGRYGMVIPRFVSAALDGQPLPVHGDGQQSRSFLHVHDAVAGILALADCPAAVGQVFNIGSSEEITVHALADRVLEHVTAIGMDGGEIALVPYAEAYAEGFEDIRRRVADTTKINALVGWRPRHSLDDILSDVIKEMRSSAEDQQFSPSSSAPVRGGPSGR